MNAITFLLQENVLTDNLLLVPENGYIFKGGYIAKIKEYHFLNAWNDKETVKLFRKKQPLFDYLKKNYPDFDLSDIEL